jgi:ferredoxin-NADP reductase
VALRVCSIRRSTASTRVVRLDLDGARYFYEPGQAAHLAVEGGAAAVPYSIASAPEESERYGWLEFLIKLEPGGGWGPHLAGLARGSRVSLSAPFGAFVFPARPTERRFLFVAGGTGIAPLRSMIRHALLAGQPGSFKVLFSARTPDDFPYLTELRGMARRGDVELSLTATRDVTERWRGDRGRVTPARLSALIDHPETLCFICGPALMVAEVPAMLRELGVDRRRIKVEQR